ncbi:dienelactone hydrolase family protein [Comamonas thiooxydans]|uniref:dienelactone hydrolase family protein n=1 Tax=Comamonas thiooxydans TaxID=363952 RepID=UPI001F5EDDA1|nr:dienelactone hydrolase family protein [Comamonas thiooxydans]
MALKTRRPHLAAADGSRFAAYVAEPATAPRGAIIVLQEIFGVNSHIRAVADGYAEAGYLAVAPETFARVRSDVDFGYTPDEIRQGAALKAEVEALPAPGVLQDIQAAVLFAARAGKVGMVGYCWGGLLTWRAAEKLDGLSAAVTYYGGGMTVGDEPSRRPRVPVMSHFGIKDPHIPVDGARRFGQLQPQVEVHLYEADHGFNCDQRGSFNAGAAKTALERSLFHFKKYLA